MQPVVTTVNEHVNGVFGMLQDYFGFTDNQAMFVFVTAIVVIGLMLVYVVRPIIFQIVERTAADGHSPWVAAANQHKVFHRLAWISPGIFALIAAPLIERLALPMADKISNIVAIGAEIYLVGVIAAIISALLSAAETRLRTFSLSRKYTIKSYIQVAKILIFSFAVVMMIAIILGRSPIYLLTGLGALTAVGVVVFRDPLMGFVTSIHLSANDIIRIGDWIEIPKFGVDGNVIDISLTTIKVQNFDKSIITIPSGSISSDGVKNWRGMMQTGCRRIKRHLTIDLDSVQLCNSDEIERLRQIPLLNARLNDYLASENRHVDKAVFKLLETDERGLTNLTLYRLYLEAYLKQHPRVSTDFSFQVRELQNDNYGIPIEICIFLNVNQSEIYEGVQSDIFDFAYAVLPLFGLEAYQAEKKYNTMPLA